MSIGIAALALAVALVLVPRFGLLALWNKLRAGRMRALAEDALKHVHACQQGLKQASLESLAGALGISSASALRVATGLEAAGCVEIGAAGIVLTADGLRRALQVVRAHRLWERHLSDDANMPIARLHQAAERAEHTLTSDQLARLDAHLGHPQHDPHGDPIPSADGHLAELDAVGLNEWPEGRAARIVHVEDEPDPVFRQILAAGLRPATVLRIIRSDTQQLLLEFDGRACRIDRAVAANIQVAAARSGDSLPAGAARLADLPRGATGEVIRLGPDCSGFSRRRLLDLGLTPGARVGVALGNTFGEPRGFRIRGTTVALREQQASQVWVRPLAEDRA